MNIVAFVDHEIGYILLNRIINDISLNLLAVVTTSKNDCGWWPAVSPTCKEHDIPLLTFPVSSIDLKKYGEIDAIFLLSWKHIIGVDLISLPKIGVINLHYSLLPKYRGVYPVNRALINGDSRTGVTYHFVNMRIDAGPIICQSEIEISAFDTARSLQIKLDKVAENLFCEMLLKLNGKPVLDGEIENKGHLMTLSEYRDTDEIHLDDHLTAQQFINLLRGKTFFPEDPQLFYIDPTSGEKIFISINLTKK